jgi:hypothetical protein
MSRKYWYEDRNFPEIKAGNDDIVAHVPLEEQRLRVIKEHNVLVDEVNNLKELLHKEKAKIHNLREDFVALKKLLESSLFD